MLGAQRLLMAQCEGRDEKLPPGRAAIAACTKDGDLVAPSESDCPGDVWTPGSFPAMWEGRETCSQR